MATPLDVITLQEAKDYLRVDFADDDALISRLIGVAVDLVENHTYHRLFNRDIVTGIRPGFEVYDYPFTITSIGNNLDYTAYLKYGYTRLEFSTTGHETLTLNVGYATKSAIPPQLLEACYKLLTYLYEHRDVREYIIPSDVYGMLQPYRRYATI